MRPPFLSAERNAPEASGLIRVWHEMGKFHAKRLLWGWFLLIAR
jgi:hypothetical protein